MEAKLKYLSLFILPVTLFILANLFTSATIPYFLNENHDPSYFYLLNSLNLAQLSGYGVGHVEHPGTTLQTLGGIVIKIYFTMTGKNQNMVLDVFHRPEEYLRAINMVIVFLNSTALLYLGITVFKIYKNVWPAIFLQFSIFLSLNVFLKMTEVTVENLSIFATLVLIIISLKFINEKEPKGKRLLMYMISFSLIIGFGVATKLTFIPMFMIPLVLVKKITRKFLLMILTAASFIIFVSPALDNYKLFYRWVKGLVFKEGVYGSGESNILDLSQYVSNIRSVFTTEYIFTLIYIVIVICLVAYLVIMLRKKSNGTASDSLNNEYRLLLGIVMAISLQIILISKHFVPRYMMTSVIISLTGLFLVIFIFSKVYSSRFKGINLNFIYIILIALIVRINFNKFITFYNNSEYKMHELIKTPEFVSKTYPDAVIITGHKSFNEHIALFLGSAYAGSQSYRDKLILKEQFPNQLIYVDIFDEIYDLSSSTHIQGVLLSKKKMIFVENPLNSIDSLILKLEKEYVFESTGYTKVYENSFSKEKVYEIHHTSEDKNY